MSEPKTSQVPHSSDEPLGKPRSPNRAEFSYQIERTPNAEKEPDRGDNPIVFSVDTTGESLIEAFRQAANEDLRGEPSSEIHQRPDLLSDLRTNVSENTEKISALNQDLTQMEKEVGDFISSRQLSEQIKAETAKQVNERIIAPLLFGGAIVLTIAAIGALLSGAWLTTLIIAPIPVISFYYLWKSRDV